MSTELLRPNGAGDLTALTPQDPELLLTNWECVAESSADDATTYVFTTGTSYLTDSYALENHAGAYGAVNSVTVYVRCRKVGTSTNNQVIPILRLGGTTVEGSQFSITTSWAEYSQVVSRPGGGSWSASDIDSLQAGVKCRARGVAGEHPEVTQVWIVVDYTLANHPSPTNLECERQSQPTDASEDPVFSAQWNATAGSGTATHAYVQVSTVSNFASTVWDSGWIDITDISHGNRCQLIDYNGSELSSDPPNGWYYWRIKFKDGSAIESDYSAYAQFKGINRIWADEKYCFRRKMLFNTKHSGCTDDYTHEFKIKTGNRYKIATNGAYNEAIQESGYAVAEFGTKKHVVYLGQLESDFYLGIYIQSYDYVTNKWGTPYKIDNAHTGTDTHYYPTITIDNTGYLHVFYGCHYTATYYAKSVSPNQSGAFAGETGWTLKGTLGSQNTYPIAIVVPSSNRIYMFARKGPTDAATKVVLYYSDTVGESWSSEQEIINYNDVGSYRTYMYGLRLDKNERIHIAWSFVGGSNIALGVWYAYSDYNEGGSGGFATWRTIAGIQCGTTGTGINKASAGAVIENETGNRVSFFCRHLTLTRDNKPVVLWAYAPDFGAPDGDGGLGSSRYASGAWQHTYMTEDLDFNIRMGRCGSPAICDKDGTIHCYTVADSRAYKHHIPAADGFHTNISRSTGSVNYALVDDGIQRYDADDTYLHASSTCEASFTKSATLPSDVLIIGVGVAIAAKKVSGTPDLRAILRISSTDYQSPDLVLTNTAYGEKIYIWTTNPSTSAAWTKAAAETVEFGFKQLTAGASIRVSRVNRLVEFVEASDDESYSSEIIELLSNDAGATWAKRSLTGNSSIGVPILNIKHSLTNNRIDLMWTSGNDVFQLTASPYGKIRRDVKDLRVYWGTTELDRVIDYANYEETIVSFRAPEALSAGKKAGAKDLYVYYGAPDIATNPKSDPTIVYPLGYENFETLADGANVNGVRGMTVTSSSGSVYVSPPNHPNKTATGSRSLKTAPGGTFALEKSLASALDDIIVSCALWMDELYLRTYLQLVNAAAAVLSVGINRDVSYAQYEDSTGWHDSSLHALESQMYQVALQITSVGCSAWFGGTKIADEITSSIANATKWKLKADQGSYFDQIIVKRKKDKRQTTTVTSSFTDNTISYSTDHTATYEATQDGKHEMAQNDVWKLDVKIRAKLTSSSAGSSASFHVWVSSGATYDATKAVANSTATITNLTTSFQSTTVSFDLKALGLPLGQYSVKVDYYAVTVTTSGNVTAEIEEIKIYWWDLNPVIDLQPEEVAGFTTDIALLGAGVEQFTIDMKLDKYFTRSTAVLASENNSALQTRSLLPTELRGSLQARSGMSVEFSAALVASLKQYMESLAAIAIATKLPDEYSGSLQAKIAVPVEANKQLATAQQIFSEWRSTLQASTPLPVDSLAGIELRSMLPAEYKGNVAILFTLPLDYVRSLSAISGMPADLLHSLVTPAGMAVENARGLTAAVQLPIELRGGFAVVLVAPVETLRQLAAAMTSPAEINKLVAAGQIVPVESLRSVANAVSLPVEWTGQFQVAMTHALPVEFLGSVQISGIVPVETNRAIAAGQKLAVDFSGSLIVKSAAAVEWLASTQIVTRLLTEHLRTLQAANSVLVEVLMQRLSMAKAPVELAATITFAQQIAVEWLGAQNFQVSAQLPVEWRSSVDARGRVEIESLSVRTLSALLPAESLKSVSGGLNAPVELSRALAGVIAGMNTEFLRKLAAQSQFQIDTGTIVTSVLKTNIEHALQVILATKLPLEFSGATVVSMSSAIPVEWKASVAANTRLPIESRATINVVGGTLLVETGKAFAASNRLAVEHNKAISAAQGILAEWMGRIGATGHMSIDFVSPVSGSITTHIEFNRAFSLRSRLEVEALRGIIAQSQLPVEYIGVFLAVLAIANARLFVPELGGAMLRTPELTEVLLQSLQLSGAAMKSASLNAAITRVTELIKARIRRQ